MLEPLLPKDLTEKDADIADKSTNLNVLLWRRRGGILN